MEDREIKARLQNFRAVWQRVGAGREPAAPPPRPALMPRRRKGCCRR